MNMTLLDCNAAKQDGLNVSGQMELTPVRISGGITLLNTSGITYVGNNRVFAKFQFSRQTGKLAVVKSIKMQNMFSTRSRAWNQKCLHMFLLRNYTPYLFTASLPTCQFSLEIEILKNLDCIINQFNA